MVEEIKYYEEDYKVKEKVSLKTLRVIERLCLLASAVIGGLLTYSFFETNYVLKIIVGVLIATYIIVSVYSAGKIIDIQNLKR